MKLKTDYIVKYYVLQNNYLTWIRNNKHFINFYVKINKNVVHNIYFSQPTQKPIKFYKIDSKQKLQNKLRKIYYFSNRQSNYIQITASPQLVL